MQQAEESFELEKTEVPLPSTLDDLAFKAVAATFQWSDRSIKFTEHEAIRTEIGFAMKDDGIWTPVTEIDDEIGGSDAVVRVLPINEPITDELRDEIREELWLRFAHANIV